MLFTSVAENTPFTLPDSKINLSLVLLGLGSARY